ncbi:SDR family NAD(P)-dependent oxidoreductase [Paraneptunicella aestuarii]|uniref:SDR family NAD(P)-dependent oxidoreductase n=1 Tax=Paraneptunicella aestuarii TaxID=2831148 RepID=UPI001E639DDD|nr:SDR family NAD(P)-dependent oxidoreductase [Paraneptunicella aestuarii]UAA38611.1 SDR family NAD(P)-dependent oxidoreductase [Paraneptunicella aestuarii]
MNTILITGAGRRLGLYLTEAFLQQGWNVIAFTRSGSEALNNLDSKHLFQFELPTYSQQELSAALTQIKQQFGTIQAVVHNASVFEQDDKHKLDAFAFYEQLFHVHMRVPMAINELSAELLANEQTAGNIIHITDIYADNPNEAYSMYCSTKAGLENLNKSYAKKFAPGIRVNSIAPGPMMFLEEHSEQEKQTVVSETLLPMEHGFKPVLMAINAILKNHYMTGSCVRVDGGRAIKRG